MSRVKKTDKGKPVNEIIKRASGEQFLKDQLNYDPDRQIWCVFDRDDRGTVFTAVNIMYA